MNYYFNRKSRRYQVVSDKLSLTLFGFMVTTTTHRFTNINYVFRSPQDSTLASYHHGNKALFNGVEPTSRSHRVSCVF